MTITPSDAQWAAIKQAKAWYAAGDRSPQVFRLAGLAGVGKSSIYEMLCEELNVTKRVTCAPTGKAAHVLRRKGVDAMTCHAALYIPEEGDDGKVEFKLNHTGALADVDLIGIDEGSMVDDVLGADFESFGKKILVMYDPGQLPPVRHNDKGQGYFTVADPDVFLQEIHRQAADNPIIRLAHHVRLGKAPPMGEWSGGGGAMRVLPLTKDTQPLLYREDTQAIAGIKRVVRAYTQRIRKMRGFDAPYPMLGDKIMCVRNNRELGIFNGMPGTVTAGAEALRSTNWRMSVQMDDMDMPLEKLEVHPWHFQQHFAESAQPRFYKGVEQFDWSNVLTGHKAQGSEWDDVTIVDDSGAFREHRWRWLYTVLTRAAMRSTLLRRV